MFTSLFTRELRRACIAAVVLLKTTVDFDGTQDQMYYIGPLLFWACAEMTCGFFILCVPYLPGLLADSGGFCSRLFRVKKILGNEPHGAGSDSKVISSSASKAKFAVSYYASRKKSFPRAAADIFDTSTTVDASAYYQIDEEVVGLNDLKTSESTEQLRKSHYFNGSGVRVTKTVVVTQS